MVGLGQELMAVLKGARKVAGVRVADFVGYLNHTEAIVAQQAGGIIHAYFAQITKSGFTMNILKC